MPNLRTEDFDRYWDAVAAGEPAPWEGVDPIRAETVRRFHAALDVPAAEPVFLSRLERELGLSSYTTERMSHGKETTLSINGHRVMASIDRSAKEQTMSTAVTWGVGRAASKKPGARRAVDHVGRQRKARLIGFGNWASSRLAAAAVVLIALFGIYQVALNGLPTDTGLNGAIIQAPATKCGTTSGGAITQVGSPVSIDVQKASPSAANSDTISFVWASGGVPNEEQLFSKLAIDPQCHIWVVDQLANRFLIFDADGNLLDTWAAGFDFGGPDVFAWGGSIAFASDGSFYVSDVMNERVQQFNSDRRFVRSWVLRSKGSVQSGVPMWIAVGPDGNVYVAVDTDIGIIQVYSSNGTFVRSFGSQAIGPGHLSGAGPIAFDPAGNIWVADADDRSLVQFSAKGEPLLKLQPSEIGSNPLGLAIDAAGRFFVLSLDDNIVSVFDPNGTLDE